MEKENFFNELEEIVDLGDPVQVQLYTDILSDQSTEGKLSKTSQLLNQIISKIKNGTINFAISGPKSPKTTTKNSSEEISRLLAHLQHFVSILESFSINSEYLNLFIENKETSSKIIPRTFFEAEAARLKSFIETFSDREFVDSFLSKIQPEFLTQKLKELRAIQSKVENSTNVMELKNHFQEICTLFELSSLLNDRLIVKLRSIEKDANLRHNESNKQKEEELKRQIESLSQKLNEQQNLNDKNKSIEKVEMNTKVQKFEAELIKLRQLCKDYSLKSDELFEKNKKLKQELNSEKQKNLQKKKEIQSIQNQLEKVKNSNIEKEEKYKKEIDELKSDKTKSSDLKDDEIEKLKIELNKMHSISSQFQSLKEKYSQCKMQADRCRTKESDLIKENDQLKAELGKMNSLSSQLQSLKEKFNLSKKQNDQDSIKISDLTNENDRLKSIIETSKQSLNSLKEENKKLQSEISSLKEKSEGQNLTSNSEMNSDSNSVIIEKSMSKIASMKKKNKKLKIFGKKIIEENDALRSELDALKSELNNLKSEKLIELNKNKELNDQLIELKNKSNQDIQTLKKQLDTEKNEMKSNQMKIFDENNKLNSQNEFLIKNLASFKDKFNMLKQETNKELKALNSQVDVLKKQKSELKITVERLRKNAPSDSQISETISSLEMEKNELKKENELLTNQLNEMKRENSQIAKISDEIASKYEDRIDSIRGLKREIEKLSRMKDQIESQINSTQPTNLNSIESNSITNTIANLDENSDLNSKVQLVDSHSLMNKMEVSKFAMMLAGALAEPLQMDKVKNEIFRLIDIVRSEHALVSASQNSSADLAQQSGTKSGINVTVSNSESSLNPIGSTFVPILLPQFDDLDREIVNLQRCIKRK